jgi:hypothetical protein
MTIGLLNVFLMTGKVIGGERVRSMEAEMVFLVARESAFRRKHCKENPLYVFLFWE